MNLILKEQLKKSVDDWVEKKDIQENKKSIKKKLTNSEDWRYLFVHGKVKSEEELEFIKLKSIEVKT